MGSMDVTQNCCLSIKALSKTYKSLCLLFPATVSHYTFFSYIKRLFFCTRHLLPIGGNQITSQLVLERHHRLSSSSLSLRSPYFALALLGYFSLMFQCCNILSLNPVLKHYCTTRYTSLTKYEHFLSCLGIEHLGSVSISCSWLKSSSCLPQHHRGGKHCFGNDNSLFFFCLSLFLPCQTLAFPLPFLVER